MYIQIAELNAYLSRNREQTLSLQLNLFQLLWLGTYMYLYTAEVLQGRKAATKRTTRVGRGRRGKRKRQQVEEEDEEVEEESMMMEESVGDEGGEEVKKLLRRLIKVRITAHPNKVIIMLVLHDTNMLNSTVPNHSGCGVAILKR